MSLQLVVVKDVLHLQFNQEEFTIKDADIFCKTERPLLDVNENINQLIAGFFILSNLVKRFQKMWYNNLSSKLLKSYFLKVERALSHKGVVQS